MNYVYYIQNNVVCMAVLAVILWRVRPGSKGASSTQVTLRAMIITGILLCLSDLLAGVLRGADFAGARLLIELSNMFYIETLTLLSFQWSVYTLQRTERYKNTKQIFVLSLPFLAETILLLTNPMTHLMFVIDENNLYSRAPGLVVHWVLSWFYLIFGTATAADALFKEKSRIKREELKPLLYFIIAPIIGSLAQMLFYGVSSTQAGITVGMTMVVLSMQDNQISVDELTGINNHRGLGRFAEDNLDKENGTVLFALFVDINRFRKINEKMGHAAGDLALKDAAGALKNICGKINSRVFLCRAGGDEFVIVGTGDPQKNLSVWTEQIRRAFIAVSANHNRPFTLEANIGTAVMECRSNEDFEQLLQKAKNEAAVRKARSKTATKQA